MGLKPGDYVRFAHDKHQPPQTFDGNGKPTGPGPKPAAETHIGRVEKNPAQGLVNGGFVDIPGLVSVLYLTRGHGCVERVLLPESALTLVLPSPN